MLPLVLLGLGAAGVYYLVYESQKAPQQSGTHAQASASGAVTLPAVHITASPTGTPQATASSAPAVPSATGNTLADDIAHVIATADDIVTAATKNNDFPVRAVVATHDTGPSGNLNVRTKPSESAAKEGSVPHGAIIDITGPTVVGDGSQPGGWAPVSDATTGISGYASMAFLDTDPTSIQAALTQANAA